MVIMRATGGRLISSQFTRVATRRCTARVGVYGRPMCRLLLIYRCGADAAVISLLHSL